MSKRWQIPVYGILVLILLFLLIGVWFTYPDPDVKDALPSSPPVLARSLQFHIDDPRLLEGLFVEWVANDFDAVSVANLAPIAIPEGVSAMTIEGTYVCPRHFHLEASEEITVVELSSYLDVSVVANCAIDDSPITITARPVDSDRENARTVESHDGSLILDVFEHWKLEARSACCLLGEVTVLPGSLCPGDSIAVPPVKRGRSLVREVEFRCAGDPIDLDANMIRLTWERSRLELIPGERASEFVYCLPIGARWSQSKIVGRVAGYPDFSFAIDESGIKNIVDLVCERSIHVIVDPPAAEGGVPWVVTSVVSGSIAIAHTDSDGRAILHSTLGGSAGYVTALGPGFQPESEGELQDAKHGGSWQDPVRVRMQRLAPPRRLIVEVQSTEGAPQTRKIRLVSGADVRAEAWDGRGTFVFDDLVGARADLLAYDEAGRRIAAALEVDTTEDRAVLLEERPGPIAIVVRNTEFFAGDEIRIKFGRGSIQQSARVPWANGTYEGPWLGGDAETWVSIDGVAQARGRPTVGIDSPLIIDGREIVELVSGVWQPTRFEVLGAVSQTRYGFAMPGLHWEGDTARVFCPRGGTIQLYDRTPSLIVSVCPDAAGSRFSFGQTYELTGVPSEGMLVAADATGRILVRRPLYAADEGVITLPIEPVHWFVDGWRGENAPTGTSSVLLWNLDPDPTGVRSIGESRSGVDFFELLPQWVWSRTHEIDRVSVAGSSSATVSSGDYDRISVEVAREQGEPSRISGLAPGSEVEITKD